MPDIEAARAVFDQFDVDGDGFVTPEELRKMLLELGDVDITEHVAQDLIGGNDLSGDGVLSFDEFWTARQAAREE
jgi:Ca2+-binding EF-hand superfamily protein